MDIASWVTRGAKLAEEFAYTGIERDGVPSADYKSKQLDLCRKQAVLAGFHLAEEINRLLASESGLKRVSHGDLN